MTRYAILDFESNGLAPERGGRVLEAAVVLVQDGAIAASWQSLMNPGVPVPPFVTTLTGITASMVREAPPPAAVLSEMLAFIGDATLVAHHASSDRQLWSHELALAGLQGPDDFICTLRLARRLYPWARDHRLGTLVTLHQIPVPGLHQRAHAEALLTAQLFLRMNADLAELYPGEFGEEGFLARYQKTGKAKAKSVTASAGRA